MLPASSDKIGPDIAVPLYLDESAMLDLLASIDDGFVTVERITSKRTDISDKEGSISGDASSAGWLGGVMKIGFAGSAKASRSQNQDQQREGERYHTPGSLLHRLRSLLLQHGLLKQLSADHDSWRDIQASDFVEFRGSMIANPFSQSVKTIINAIRLMERLQEHQGAQSISPPSPANKTSLAKKNLPPRDNPFIQTLEILLSDLEREGEQTLVITPSISNNESAYLAVASLSIDHLRVPSLNEFANGEYRVLGHVTRHLREGDDSSINLLKGSVFGSMAETIVDPIVNQLNEQFQLGAWRVDTASSTIAPPAFQLYPIAIYT